MLAIKRAKVPLKRDLILLATADEEAGSRFGAQWVADQRRDWLDGAEYALSELGLIVDRRTRAHRRRSASIVISEKTGLPLRLTARSEPGHGSMPWPDTAPQPARPRARPAARRGAAAARAARDPGVLRAHGLGAAGGRGAGYERLERSLARSGLPRALPRRPARRPRCVRTTFAVTMLKGSEKRNVIPPEAVADLDCRMLAGDDPEEIVAWVRGVIADRPRRGRA